MPGRGCLRQEKASPELGLAESPSTTQIRRRPPPTTSHQAPQVELATRDPTTTATRHSSCLFVTSCHPLSRRPRRNCIQLRVRWWATRAASLGGASIAVQNPPTTHGQQLQPCLRHDKLPCEMAPHLCLPPLLQCQWRWIPTLRRRVELRANKSLCFPSRSLYRRSLKLSLDWAVHRHLWRGQALYIRSLFEANRHVTEPRKQRVRKATPHPPLPRRNEQTREAGMQWKKTHRQSEG